MNAMSYKLWKKEHKMPLKKGSSSQVVSQNISKIMREYKAGGKRGTSPRPKNKAAALKQAVAASLSSAGRSKPKK